MPLASAHSPGLPLILPHRLAHIKFAGQARFQAPFSVASVGGGWHKLTAEAYISAAGSPAFVWSATVALTPLSWVRGYASYLRGAGSTHWKLCSPFRVRDLEAAALQPALGQSALTAFLAGE